MYHLASENVQKVKADSFLNEGIIAEQLIIFIFSSFFALLCLHICIQESLAEF